MGTVIRLTLCVCGYSTQESKSCPSTAMQATRGEEI